jgi:hypothetical protein
MNKNAGNNRARARVVTAALLCAFAFVAEARAQTSNPPTHAKPATPAAAAHRAAARASAYAGPVLKKTAAGEAFFIVGSVDPSKSQVLLKYPTEVTLLVNVDAKTQFFDDSGKPLKITDFRAGDTVWVTTAESAGVVNAVRIRKGQMTVADLHRYYLDYPEIK